MSGNKFDVFIVQKSRRKRNIFVIKDGLLSWEFRICYVVVVDDGKLWIFLNVLL